MDNDLDRSVRLLEDALATSTRGLFKSPLIKKRQEKEHSPNLSITLSTHELTRAMRNAEVSMYNNAMSSILNIDKSVTGSVIQNSLPWKTTVDSLYAEFFEVLQSHSGGHDILDIVTDLARCCSDALNVVRGLKSKVKVGLIDEEKWLENERNTWRLLYILYHDRNFSQNLMVEDDAALQYVGKSEKSCIECLFKRDSLVRESQLVIDWLESNAKDRDDEVLHFTDSTVGWENTLHQLQSAETIAFGSTRQIVSEMDPDAPNHQWRPLHDLDMDDEKRLNQKIFTEIRCGKLEEAQKLCRQCGHSWRASIFEGWRLFHNPNIKENVGDDDEQDNGFEDMPQEEYDELEGNHQRDIWKIMAIKFCKQDYLNVYEKAAVASFCGYVDGLLPVCNSWEDNLWAYMKAMVDIRVESEIRDCVLRNDKYMPLPDDYWSQRMSLNEVFSSLESSRKTAVRSESQMREHVIQKYIILDETHILIRKLEDWVDDPLLSTHFLRFAAHLVLFFDQIGQGQNRGSVELVLEAYIRRLTEMRETQLVSYYVSKLSPSNQVLLYASYLEKIIDNEERKESLLFAEDCGLDVLSITKQVVENIRNYSDELDSAGNLQQKITEMDKLKISSLDWIIFYENQRAEALVQTNALIFTFLTLGKLDAAQLAFNKIPAECVEKILSEGDVTLEINQAIKEHLSYKAYLDAQEAFNEYFTQCKSKPIAPDDLPETAQFPEKVAHQHRVSQFKAETERWKLTMYHLGKSAKTLLYNILLFPDGWLVGAKDDAYLRSTCIPEIVLLLYSVLQESEQHEECVQLADIIASEKHALYQVYSKEKLGEILEKLCESSVALLNAKKDPWGNETSA